MAGPPPSCRPESANQARNWAASGAASLALEGSQPLNWPAGLLESAPRLRSLECRGVGSAHPRPAASLSLGPFSGLRRLSLEGCGLTDAVLDWAGFACMPALGRLSLRGNRLMTARFPAGSCPGLRELDLAHNEMEEWGEVDVPVWLQLCVLDLSHNRLRRLPARLGGLSKLERLQTGHNLSLIHI